MSISLEWCFENKLRRFIVIPKVKSMLTVFFYYQDVVHSQFVSEGHMLNKKYFWSFIKCLYEDIQFIKTKLIYRLENDYCSLCFCKAFKCRISRMWYFVILFSFQNLPIREKPFKITKSANYKNVFRNSLNLCFCLIYQFIMKA